ncbi:MAG: hypothetical protein ACOC8H_00360 [bacterium]
MIEFKCSECGKQLRVKDDGAGKKGKCPQCRAVLLVPAKPEPSLHPANGQPNDDIASDVERTAPRTTEKATRQTETADTQEAPRPVTDGSYSEHLDNPIKIALGAGGIGLVILALSPMFKWIKFVAGGVTGISGDGKIVLGITVVSIIALGLAVFTRRRIAAASLGVGAWGTIALFWMAGLIWKVGALLDSPETKGNPFAAMLATQVSPGSGLYIGLIGGFIAAGALGYVAYRQLQGAGRIRVFYIAQSCALVLGVTVAMLFGFERPSTYRTTEQNSAGSSLMFPGAREASDRAAAQAQWRTSNNVSDEQWNEMIANYKIRKLPESVSMTDWWEEAKNKTPAELNKLYPPLQPHEWYVAEWAGGYSGSRELDRDFGYGDEPTTYKLTLKVRVRTEPDIPIKELHGQLAFVKDGRVIYEARVVEKPDVSFTDSCLVWLKIDPYDDNNPTHRVLRYTEDDELRPVFSVSKVVLADGTEKTFDMRGGG